MDAVHIGRDDEQPKHAVDRARQVDIGVVEERGGVEQHLEQEHGDGGRAASFAAFAVIAIGAAGSVHAGMISDRLGRAEAAAVALRWSASVALVVGFLVDAPWPVVLGVGLVWGYWVVADSAQFSTVVTEVTDARYVGTALTMQLAAGFVLTVFTIFLVPVVRDAAGWGWAFALLAPGPLLGSWAMRRLRSLGPPDRVTDQPAATFVSPFF